MHHVAIMKKSWGLIPKILSGEKSIESRWYRTRRDPWNTAAPGDTVFFKNTGEPVIARAEISDVLRFEIKDIKDAERIMRQFGPRIMHPEPKPRNWPSLPRYAILLVLANPKPVARPFLIDKRGFGASAAWLSVLHIRSIRIPTEAN